MEHEADNNYSRTDTTEYFNLLATTPIAKEQFEWTDERIARIIEIITRPLLIIMGTMGNRRHSLCYEENFTKGCIKLFLHVYFGSSRFK